MPRVSHINWPDFPVLVARLKEIEAELAQGVVLPLLYSVPESSQILEGIGRSVKGINVATCQTAPVLDQFLEKIDAHFVANFGAAGLSPDSNFLLTSVSQAFRSKPCVNCGAVRKCDPSSELANAKAVNEFGQCFQLLRGLFDFVVECCCELYGQYAGVAPSFTLSLSTEPLGKRNPVLDLAIAGQTREVSDHERSIKISMMVAEFGLADYFACLYIMFHECFVHGWCGIALDSGEASHSDSFHEGWMDWVGFELLKGWLSASPTAKSVNLLQHASEFLNAGAVAKGRRVNYITPFHRNAARDKSAATAAECLLNYFKAVLEDPKKAEAAFFRFSLGLNASTIDDRQRERLVINVLLHLSGRTATKTFINNINLWRKVEQFERTGVVKVLTDALNSL